jgi:hypothetical protein
MIVQYRMRQVSAKIVQVTYDAKVVAEMLKLGSLSRFFANE